MTTPSAIPDLPIRPKGHKDAADLAYTNAEVTPLNVWAVDRPLQKYMTIEQRFRQVPFRDRDAAGLAQWLSHR